MTKDRQNSRRGQVQPPGQGEGEAGAVACRGRGRSREGERDRKFKGIVEKIKRKLDGDLELTQEAVTSLVRIKANLYQTSMRKVSSMAAKFEDEKTLGMQYRAKVRSKSKTSMYQLEDKNRLADPSLRLRLVRRLRNWSPPNRR